MWGLRPTLTYNFYEFNNRFFFGYHYYMPALHRDHQLPSIVAITAENGSILWEMLYQAIYVPYGADPPSREIVRLPELARYVENWGRPGDLGFYAWDAAAEEPIGAAWLRLWSPGERGYGWVDDAYPELSLAVLPMWRGKGIGSRLLTHLLQSAQGKYPGISLSVTSGNPAQRLYERAGFKAVKQRR